MKLKDLKKILNKMTPEQLEQEMIYNSDDMCISGVCKAVKAKATLYNTHENDPARLYTKAQLLENGMDLEEISECDVEIKKGELIIAF